MDQGDAFGRAVDLLLEQPMNGSIEGIVAPFAPTLRDQGFALAGG